MLQSGICIKAYMTNMIKIFHFQPVCNGICKFLDLNLQGIKPLLSYSFIAAIFALNDEFSIVRENCCY